jgi:hypothetical protein
MNIYLILEDFIWEGLYYRDRETSEIKRRQLKLYKGDWIIHDYHHMLPYMISTKRPPIFDVVIPHTKTYKSGSLVGGYTYKYKPTIYELEYLKIARCINGFYKCKKAFSHILKETKPEFESYFKLFPWLNSNTPNS